MRNAIVQTVANEAHCKDRPDSCVGNADKVTFILDDGQKLLWRIKGDEEMRDVESKSSGTSHFPFGVSYFSTVFGDGNKGEDVFMAADVDFPPGTTVILRVAGLSVSSDPTSAGWLIIGPTRSGGKEFPDWFMTKVVIPAVNKIQGARAGGEDTRFSSRWTGRHRWSAPPCQSQSRRRSTPRRSSSASRVRAAACFTKHSTCHSSLRTPSVKSCL